MTGAIILAGGSSSRLGTPKQNLVYQGQTLLQRAVGTALAAGCKPVLVVLGANADLIRPTIAGLPVNIVYNSDWEEGMASSTRLGIKVLKRTDPGLTSVIFMLCDQPFVNASLLCELVQAKSKNGIAACAYNDTVGVPALFDAVYFDELLLLKGQEGAKKLLLKYREAVVSLPFPLGSVDIDTVEDYEKLNQAKAH